jgi:hypothetical protein
MENLFYFDTTHALFFPLIIMFVHVLLLLPPEVV